MLDISTTHDRLRQSWRVECRCGYQVLIQVMPDPAAATEHHCGSAGKVELMRQRARTESSLFLDADSKDKCLPKSESNRTAGAPRDRVRGVCWVPKKRKWRARVKIDGVRLSLGMFDTEALAAAAIEAARASAGATGGGEG